MKRIGVLLAAAVVLSVMLCSCMSETSNKVKNKASEVVSDLRDTMEGATETTRETVMPTEIANVPDNTESIGDMIATEWDDMVDNGQVDDGDGNVGDMENSDGD